MTATVELTGVNMTFAGRRGSSVPSLQEIDLSVEAGEFVSLIGPSGCGKSTLLRIVADLQAPSSGTVTVAGKAPRQARLDQEYGFAFQQAGLLDWRTVRANVELPLQLHGVSSEARQERVEELLGLVGLEDSPSTGRRCSPEACSSASRSLARSPSGQSCF
jgi:NitT/TauT family transport system ATP-binding protein